MACTKKEECGNCKYYDKFTDGKGWCKRFPPQLVPLDSDRSHDRSQTEWPEVFGSEWCGEFEYKEESYE